MDLKILCKNPACRRVFIEQKPPFADTYEFECPICGEFNEVQVLPDGKTVINGEGAAPAKLSPAPAVAPGKISVGGKSFPLKQGVNTIGRRDPVQKSDIQIDDDYASRRSVELTVENSGTAPRFSLRVVKALNAVTVNRRELRPGERAELAFGDRIRLGDTELILEK